MTVFIGALVGAFLGASIATIVFNIFSVASLPVKIAKIVASGAMEAYDDRGSVKRKFEFGSDFDGTDGTITIDGNQFVVSKVN